MNRWMASLQINEAQSPEVIALIPAERAHVQALREQGTLETIYIATDSSRVWLVLKGDTREAIAELLTGFPMHKYFITEITALR